MSVAEMLSADCPGCRTRLWAVRAGEWTLKSKMLKLGTNGELWAKCPDCGRDVLIPFLRLSDPSTGLPILR